MSVNLGSLFYEIGIEDNTKKDLDEAARRQQQWEKTHGKVEIAVDANIKKAFDNLEKARKAVEKADGTKAVMFVDADGEHVTTELEVAKRELAKAEREFEQRKLKIKADADGVKPEIAKVEKQVKALQETADRNPITPMVDVDKIDDGAARGRGSLLEMLGGWKVAAIAAAALGGAAIADKLIEGFNSTLERNKANDRLAASLGLSPDESRVAGALAGKLWGNAFGDSTGQVNEAVRAALLSLPQGGDFASATGDVNGIAEDALNLASIFDVDVTDSIARAAQLVKSGLAPDMTAAFDLIFASMQRIPSSMTGDLLDAVDEYSKHLAPLGFTGEQIFGLLVSASKDGTIAVDKVGDSLKEFTIRSTDMSATSVDAYSAIGLNAKQMSDDLLAGGDRGKKAFQMIVEGLLGIEDPTTRANKAIELFGTPLEDLGVQNVPAFLKSLQGMEGGLGDVEGAAKDAGRTLNDNLATDIEEVKRKLSPASLAQAFNDGGIEGVKTRVQEGVDKLKSIWEEYGPAVKTLVSEGLDELGALWDEKGPEVIAALSAWWDESGSPAVEEAVKAALGVAWEGVQSYFAEKVKDPEWWADTLNNGMVDPVVEFFADKGLELVAAATGWITGIPDAVAELAAGAWNPLAEGFEGVINAIIDTWNNLSFDLPSITVFGQTIGGGSIGNPAQIGHINIPTMSTPAGHAFGDIGSQIPRFAKGGFVDAPLGQGVLALVHGGEYVNTADDVRTGRMGAPGPRNSRQGRPGGSTTINVWTQAKTGRGTADAIDRRLMGWAG